MNPATEEISVVATGSVEHSEDVLDMLPAIVHKGFASDDLRQQYVQYAYKLGGIDFVTMLECENGNWSIWTKGDYGHAWGLCQLNDYYHYISPEYKKTWQVQIETCYAKWKEGTPFYGPSRKVHGQRCSTYVLNRFAINA